MIAFRTPMLWVIGFLALSAISGLNAVVPANVCANGTLSVPDFVAGYARWYGLCWAGVFGIFGGWYYLFPKISRRTYSGRLGKLHFWLTFISAAPLVAQAVMVEAGCWATFSSKALDIWNLVWPAGLYIFVTGILVFFANMALAFLRRRAAG